MSKKGVRAIFRKDLLQKNCSDPFLGVIKRAMRLFLIALLSLPALALAQDDPSLFGAGLYSRPKFDGSADRRIELIPFISYYGSPWFARTTQGVLEGGARWNPGGGLNLGVQVAYESGPLDHDPGASIGAHAEWERNIGPAPVIGLLRLRQHLDSDRGLQLDARATVGVYEGHGLAAGVFAQATWASEKYFQAYYGLHDSGLLFTSLGALGAYDLARRWQLIGSLEHRRLADDAAKSPIVVRRSGAYASLGLAYLFK